MLRTVFPIAVALAIAIGGGAASAWHMIRQADTFGTIAIGPWTAYPERGTPAADPYSRAHIARQGDLVLGQAEGISFEAARDTSGLRLDGRCSYLIEGMIPAARFWTLHIRSGGRTVEAQRSALHSLSILRAEDESFNIMVSRHAAPGNWLRIPDRGQVSLVLTLYDTAVATSARVAEIELPQILRTGCD